jgi:hypothetical protein
MSRARSRGDSKGAVFQVVLNLPRGLGEGGPATLNFVAGGFQPVLSLPKGAAVSAAV